VWTDAETGVALANRRLAVRDLSAAGHQPMVSDDGRLVLTYNGEIYDTDELRASLEGAGRRFRGGSDTEVLLQACAEWRVDEAVRRCNGMFAFALWDRVERRLTLARDRMGIKPLYWVEKDGLFLFASELKALVGHPGWTPEIDRDALAAFARLSYVPSPLCIWKGARKMEPGTVLTFESGKAPTIARYWNMMDVAGQGRDITDMHEAVEGLDSLLGRAVRRRLVADVPIGLFLSGGMDSATVAALMQAEGRAPVKTFTVGFAETDFDESGDAARIAKHLGTEHQEIRLSPAETLDHVADVARCYDEPFADSSQISSFLVSRLARQSVTVALSGDGGDEVFGGYNRYAWAEHHWPRLSRVPGPLRRAWAGAITAVPPVLWDRLAGVLGVHQAGEKMHKAAALLALDDEAQAYRHLTGPGIDASGLVLGGNEPPPSPPPALDDAMERMQVLDTVGYLPDDILTKVDRASMSVGLEERVPLLDHEVVAFAWRLARPLKVAGGDTKRVLRAVAEKHLPASLFARRPKSGFAVPIGAWLRGPLREWAGDLLSEQALRDQGTFDAALVGRWWREHRSGRRLRHHALWNVLMFQAWRQGQRG
jgi:asparagine synthase (glutamine-hydrolysing)